MFFWVDLVPIYTAKHYVVMVAIGNMSQKCERLLILSETFLKLHTPSPKIGFTLAVYQLIKFEDQMFIGFIGLHVTSNKFLLSIFKLKSYI